MKPTPQQIEAALRHADSIETTGGIRTRMTLRTLAAAYREQQWECENLRKSGSEAIGLYHQTSIELEKAIFGPESGKETYAKIKKQRDTLADALREYMACHKRHGYVTKKQIDKAEKALATLKGEA